MTSGGDVEGIDYGGVDEYGDLDPASRLNRDIWDEE